MIHILTRSPNLSNEKILLNVLLTHQVGMHVIEGAGSGGGGSAGCRIGRTSLCLVYKIRRKISSCVLLAEKLVLSV